MSLGARAARLAGALVDGDAAPGPQRAPRPGRPGTALVVTPRPGMSNVHAISWEYALQTGNQTVRIYYYAGIPPCTVLDHVDVAYQSDTIVISLYTGSDPSAAHQACIALASNT